MRSIRKRLACLNLAFLLALLSAAPARALPLEMAPQGVLTEGGAEPSGEGETSGEAEASDETELSDEAEASGETEPSDQTEASVEAEPSDEAEASDRTEAPAEAEALDETEPAPTATARATMSNLRLYRNLSSSDTESISPQPYLSNSSWNFFDLTDSICPPVSNGVQVGWYDRSVVTSTDLIPLTAVYRVRPWLSAKLNALWATYSEGSVILNALFGTFSNATASLDFLNQDRITYQRFGTSLPGTNYRVSGTGYRLLGWTTEHTPLRGTGGVLTGQWYGIGDATPEGVPVLYSHEYSTTNSSLVVYHPGTVKRGGTLLVQGGLSSYSAIGAGELNAPAYHRFEGWSKASGGTAVRYAAGSTVTPGAGVPTHLYAVWKDLRTPVGQGLSAILDTEARTVRLLAEPSSFPSGPFQAVLGLYRDGKLVDVAASGLGAHSSELRLEVSYTGAVPTEIKYFLLDSASRPLRSAVAVPLSQLR